MIIIGYQGIGKSTLANKYRGYIDLESSSFWNNGKRPGDWYVYYCNVAEHLSKQGYIVFVSSHKVVRNRIKECCTQKAICIHPSIHLKDEWCHKLLKRYMRTSTKKDYKAWINAKDRFTEDITDIMSCGIKNSEIESMDYDLLNIIKTFVPSVQPEQSEIIRCKDCKQFRRWIDTNICFCDITESEISDNDF